MDIFVGRSAFWVALFAFSLLVSFLAAAWHDFPVPENDSIEYLAYARSLHVAGVYAASEAGPAADSVPGREPLYSAFISGLARFNPTWSTALRDCSPPAKVCASALRFLKYANVALFALAAVIAGATAQMLSGSRLAAIVATSYVTLSFTMWRDLKYVISDYLAVFLTAVAVLSLVFALRPQANPSRWIGFGVVLALLTLTKQVFLPFAILFAILLLAHDVLITKKMDWRALAPGLSVLMVVVVINGGWLLRNFTQFGVMNDGRGSVVLSEREVFDNMTAAEHAVAFLWFMRHPGPRMAKYLFPEKNWRRFEWKDPDGFYLRAHTNRDARVAHLKSEAGLSEPVAQSAASNLVVREFLANWTGYLASMPALFYRGLWFDAFMPLSLPLFALPFFWAWHEKRWLLLVVLSPALWSLFIYPVISLNIPRYQFTAVIALAVTAGIAADRRARRRKPGIGMKGSTRKPFSLAGLAVADANASITEPRAHMGKRHARRTLESETRTVSLFSAFF